MSDRIAFDKFMEFYEVLKANTYRDFEATGITYMSNIEEDEKLTSGYFSDLLHSKQNIHPLPYSVFQIYEEIDGIMQDLIYELGIMTLMHPYLANPSMDNWTYRMGFEDQLYLRHATFAYESVHNIWDRFGDLLHLFFETGLSVTGVSFTRVLNNMENQYKTTPEYLALKTYYDTNIEATLFGRHDVVHHFQLRSITRWNHLKNYHDRQQLIDDFERTAGFLNLFKEQLRNAIEGYKLTLDLLQLAPVRHKPPAVIAALPSE